MNQLLGRVTRRPGQSDAEFVERAMEKVGEILDTLAEKAAENYELTLADHNASEIEIADALEAFAVEAAADRVRCLAEVRSYFHKRRYLD